MLCYVACCVSQLGACICEVVLGFVGGRINIMRSIRELKVKGCEMMGWCSVHSRNPVLRMAVSAFNVLG